MINMPTKEDYDKACRDIAYYLCNVEISKKVMERIIDDLCKERRNLQEYQMIINNAQVIKTRYEKYQEVLDGSNNSSC